MAELVANCPRCKTRSITFDALASVLIGVQYRWQKIYEIFSVCRNCRKSTIFILEQQHVHDEDFLDENSPIKFTDSLNNHFRVARHISLRDESAQTPPLYVDPPIANVFAEGATALAVECWNAAGTMFRLSIDLATEPLLPEVDSADGPNAKVRRDLGLRLPWLFENGRLPRDLENLSHCVREDGNDAAHRGTLKREDAEDLLDFARALLERLFTEPKRLELAEQRRTERRKPKGKE